MMKNTILILAAMFSLLHVASAQDQNTKMLFGVKGGANFSNVYDSKGEDFKADGKLGLVLGAYLTIPLMRYLAVQPEILFSQKGFKGTGNLLGSSYKLTRTTNYIDVPLLIAIRPIKELSIVAGPQFSYLMKQRDEFNSTPVNVVQEDEFKNENIRKNTLCFLGGVDIVLDRLVLGARAGWDLQNNNGNGTTSTPRYKNAWFQATVGIRL